MLGQVNSVWMDRYGVATGWIFFVTTAAQLISAACFFAINSELNMWGNLMYSVLYLSFLIAYALLKVKPSASYVGGVFLYTLGYIVFLVIYIFAAKPYVKDAVFSVEAQPQFDSLSYHLGSWFFLLGSVLLLVATKPAAGESYSPVSKGASLFYGSLCFLLGSIIFAVDASGVLSSWEGSAYLVAGGLGMFLPGRFFFLWGSTTMRSGFCCGKIEVADEPMDERV